MKRYLRLSWLTVLWLVISFGITCLLQEGTIASQEKNDVLTKALDSITNQDVEARIRFVASQELEGRLTGGQGLRMAAKYAGGEFKRCGLNPVGDKNTYFQGIELPSVNCLASTPKLSFNGKECNENDFTVFNFSGEGKIEAPIVFAGYGVTAPRQNYDDYANLDVKSKIVLVLRYLPRWHKNDGSKIPKSNAYLITKYRNAKKHGAVGLLIFAGPLQGDKGNPSPLTTTAGGYSMLGIRTKGEEKSAIPALYIKPDIAKEILKGADLAGLQKSIDDNLKPNSFEIKDAKASIEVDIKKAKKTTENVVGFLEGSNPELKDEVILIGAHYDHVGKNALFGARKGICAGADDNGSGTVAVLEIAEAFSLLPCKPKRSILFILFTGEEVGLIGSSYYIKHPIFPIDKTIAVMNIDMIGRPPGEKSRVKVYGGSGCDLFKKLCKDAAEKEGIKARLTKSAAIPSDAFVFYSKIPTIWFFSSDMKGYHSPRDTPDNILYPKMTKIVRYIFRIAYELSNTAEHPVLSVARSRVRIGIYPRDVKEGVEIKQIVSNSPAERAGLEAGDIITKIKGTKVSDIEELLDVLTTLKPGEEIEVDILRKGKVKSIKIIPEAIE